MVQVERHTHHMPVSVPFDLEPVSMTSRLVAETYSVCSRKSAASSWTARMSSVVVDAIELACAGVAHKARAALSGLSGRRHGRWCRVRAPSSGQCSGPSELLQPYVM